MKTKKIIFIALLLLTFSFNFGCSGGSSKVKKIDDTEYRNDFKKAFKSLKSLERMVNAKKISKQKYFIIVPEKSEKVKEFLTKHQDSEFADRGSFKGIKFTLKNYQVAKKMWAEDKGLALIGNRFSQAKKSLSDAESNFRAETQ